MALSSITLSVKERYAVDLAAFTLAGVPYIVWRTEDAGASRIWWRAHNGLDATEVYANNFDTYNEIAVAGRADGLTVLIVFTRGGGGSPVLRAMICNVATGAVTQAPVQIGLGTKPSLAPLLANGARIALAYRDSRSGAVHLRETYDGGLTWTSARPILNNKTNDTIDLSLVAFDGTHLSMGQVGTAGRTLLETGAVTRTRPVTAIALLSANRVAVIEAVVRTGQVADNLRGRVAFDGVSAILAGSRTRQGADDTVGSLAVYDTFPVNPVLVSGAVLAAGAAPGGEIVRAGVLPAAVGAVVLTTAGLEAILDLAVFAGHGLYAAAGSAALTGRAGWINLGTLAAGEFALGLGVTRVGAIGAAVAAAGGFDLLAVAYTASGQEWLKLGEWVSPPSGVNLGVTHLMPARVNSLAVSLTSSTAGFLYIGMTDRVNVYTFDGLAAPIRLVRTHTLLTGGEVHQMLPIANGNVVAALGTAGIAVFSPSGETLGVAAPSSIGAEPWVPVKSYLLNALVKPTPAHPYAPQRRYFICSRAGVSGGAEPAWGPTGTINDSSVGGAGWTEVGSAEPIITGVAVEPALGRIYAAGILGGPTATAGRVYTFDAAGLVSAPPRVSTPIFGVAEGALFLDPTNVQILCGNPGAAIYYTTDGSEPGPSATLYNPLASLAYPKSGTYRVRAVALVSGLRPSLYADLHFSIDLPNLPPVLAGPNAGVYYDQTLLVQLTVATLGVAIRYTLDGSDPTEFTGTLFDPLVPIPISVSKTVRARGFKYGTDDTPLAVFNYTIVQLLIPGVVGEVSHFIVVAGAVVDRNGSRGWNPIGAVPAVASAVVLTGRAPVEGIGPFTDANYYELAGSAAGTDPFDTLVTGDFVITFVMKSGATAGVWFGSGYYGGTGFYFQHAGVANCIFSFGATQISAGQNILDGNVHVVTFARRGTDWFWKVDKNAFTTGTMSAPSGGVGNPTQIGRYQFAGNSFTGIMYEARFVAQTVAGGADLDALHAAILP